MMLRLDVISLAIAAAAFAVIGFIYFPLLTVVIYSFNIDSVNAFPIRGFSLKWYEQAFSNESLLQSLQVSIIIAITATASALVIGTMGALAMHKYDFPLKRLFERVILLPITLPGILTGVAMLSFFPLIGVKLSLTAVVIGHTTFLISIVLTQVLARLKRLDPFLEEAAADLGSNRWQAFWKVVFPNIRTSLIGAALLAFTLSLDEIPVTFFLIARENTLPIEIYTMMRRGITPEVNAIATVIFTISLLTLILSVKLGERQASTVV